MMTQPLTGKRILLVDSEEFRRKVVRTILDHLFGGHHGIHETGSATEALEMIKKEQVDLVIVDHYMVGMRGDALAERVKHLRPNTPVILLTPNRAGLGPANCHANVILEVPWRIEELRRAITSVW